MLKTVLYYLLLLTTTVRLADIVYLLVKDNTNLPATVLVVTTAMVLYGIVIIAKKFLSNIRLRQIMTFYLIQTMMIVFNLIFVRITCPLEISGAETLVVGTFLDLLVNCGVLILCFRQLRSRPAVQSVSAASVSIGRRA